MSAAASSWFGLRNKTYARVDSCGDDSDCGSSLAAREHNILAAARRMGSLTDDFPAPLYETLHDLSGRAQRAGLIVLPVPVRC